MTNDALREVVDDVLIERGPASARALDNSPAVPNLWSMVVDLGWPLVGIAEEHGGAGGELSDLVTLVAGTGRHAAAIPLVETALALGVLAAHGRTDALLPSPGTVAGLEPGDDVALQALPNGEVKLHGRCTGVPWVPYATSVIVAQTNGGHAAVILPSAVPEGLHVMAGQNVAAEPRAAMNVFDVVLPGDAVIGSVNRDEVLVRAALLKLAGLAGALETAYAHTRDHVTSREQFGRPLVRFQAVSQHLAEIAGAVELSRVALRRAVTAVALDREALAHVAAARVSVGLVATEVATRCHQLHGAMGVAREHPLHLVTRRLWSWRDEWGSQHWWSIRLGELATRDDGPWAWDLVTALDN